MIPSFHIVPFGAILAYLQVQQAAKMSFGESNHPMIHVILGGWCFLPPRTMSTDARTAPFFGKDDLSSNQNLPVFWVQKPLIFQGGIAVYL